MGKSFIDINPKEAFNSLWVKEMWDEYREYFGDLVDKLFGDNYAVKLRFGGFYRSVIEGRLRGALNFLRDYKENFKTDYDLSIYKKLEFLCLNIDNMKNIKAGDWVKDDLNFYYLVLDGNIDSSTIKYAFNSKLEFVNTLDDYNYFTTEKTSLYCYRRLDKKELDTINEYFKTNENAIEELKRYTNKCFDIYSQLIKNGFKRGIYYQERFYKYLTNQTAFVINVRDHGKFVNIVYGITTVSLNQELREHFEKFIQDDDNITLRNITSFATIDEENKISNEINDFYSKYHLLNKEELLDVSKEKRKEFINCFKTLLKPYGLKKNSNKWSKDISEKLVLNFYLSKSIYSDIYYLDLWINVKDKANCICYSKRYKYKNLYSINWQFLSLKEFNKYLKEEIEKDIYLITNSTLEDLKKEKEIISNYSCEKNRCENCWLKIKDNK